MRVAGATGDGSGGHTDVALRPVGPRSDLVATVSCVAGPV